MHDVVELTIFADATSDKAHVFAYSRASHLELHISLMTSAKLIFIRVDLREHLIILMRVRVRSAPRARDGS